MRASVRRTASCSDGSVPIANSSDSANQMSKENRSRLVRHLTYEAVGVRNASLEEGDLRELGAWVNKTFHLNRVEPELPLGYFANVLKLSHDLGLAISTDGVGTKILVAQDLGKYDTIGIDCVAMNANDIICVGARPISMVDYIAVQRADPSFLGEIGKGLYEGARAAEINIPGGEIAQVKDMIHGTREGYAFDLVGTCVGTVHPERIIVGQDIQPGDLIVGIGSSGIHSNGLTLARKVLFERPESPMRSTDYIPELGRTIGEELLEPTHIYVREVMQMLEMKLDIKALIHITSDGFMNLARVAAEVGFVIERPLEPQPIFSAIQERGGLDDAEMFRVFNMGTGFCIVVNPKDANRVQKIATGYGRRTRVIGYVVPDPERRVWIPDYNLVGQNRTFEVSHETPPQRPTP